MTRLLTAKQVAGALERLYASIVADLPSDRRLAVIGMRTRGETLAARIAERLRGDKRGPSDVCRGVLDITFYRDDLSRRHGAPLVRATEIDFDLNDTWVLLVDDVLQTGRSVRAALDAIHDFGRPLVIRLAVLIDRGGRELPISADFVGTRVKVPHGQRVQLRLEENDGEEGAWVIKNE
ncbi:MAG TPA: bifunctional pyr operon transcriptional regulator/uracil phosphoribosyltransferase PyrR [Phycisphaerae bacterium]|nr:bifunctional pyr operon transcriptional regulator/uracil phosphoribosyltransferase PyrR [Phycisphaerae bacterium]